MKKSRAVTLLELIVVIAIISALTAFSVVSFSLVPSRRIQADAYKLASDLRWARSMAVSGADDLCVRFDYDSDQERYFYRVDKNTCKDDSSFLSRHYLQTQIDSPGISFDLVFCTFTSGYDTDVCPALAGGGTAYSDESDSDNKLSIDLTSDGSKGWRVYVYGSSGYVDVEKW